MFVGPDGGMGVLVALITGVAVGCGSPTLGVEVAVGCPLPGVAVGMDEAVVEQTTLHSP